MSTILGCPAGGETHFSSNRRFERTLAEFHSTRDGDRGPRLRLAPGLLRTERA